MVKVKGYAKINLTLDILSKLDNGYHGLWMIMQSVNLYDIISAEKTKSGIIEFSCNNSSIPSDEKNIAFKAAKAFFDYGKFKNTGVKIFIEKNIPVSAGLAGGSADAAATLVALNKLFDTDYSAEQLCEIGINAGADVPFCIVGGTCLAQDMGQVLSPLPHHTDCHFVLIKPKSSVSTAKAYSDYDAAENIRHPDKSLILHYAAFGRYDEMYKHTSNVFEQVIEVPERVEIKKIMRDNFCKLTLMSGSGPTIYGVFENKKDAEKCSEELKSFSDEIFICEPMKFGTHLV